MVWSYVLFGHFTIFRVEIPLSHRTGTLLRLIELLQSNHFFLTNNSIGNSNTKSGLGRAIYKVPFMSDIYCENGKQL